MSCNIQARTLVDLILEATKHNTRTIEIVWEPAYNEEEHGRLSFAPALIAELKKSKTDELDILDDNILILELLHTPKDVKSMEWKVN